MRWILFVCAAALGVVFGILGISGPVTYAVVLMLGALFVAFGAKRKAAGGRMTLRPSAPDRIAPTTVLVRVLSGFAPAIFIAAVAAAVQGWAATAAVLAVAGLLLIGIAYQVKSHTPRK